MAKQVIPYLLRLSPQWMTIAEQLAAMKNQTLAGIFRLALAELAKANGLKVPKTLD